MSEKQPVRDLIDLTDPARCVPFNRTMAEARADVASGDPGRVRRIDGPFAIAARKGHFVRLARSISVPMRYFIVKQADGPALVVAHRMDDIETWMRDAGFHDQYHPTYTRMVPAHYITEIALVGCPDPNPTYTRFFSPEREVHEADIDKIGRAYIETLDQEIGKWLSRLDDDAPIGVCFSGGVDSGAVLLVLYHRMLAMGHNPGRLKAFTLSVSGAGDDLDQSRRFLEAVDLQLLHEAVEVPEEWIDFREAIRTTEDYKPLDIQSAAMALALCRGIRRAYPGWRHLIDGDGGDENLKDYPIEENPELTIRSVLNNRMLYQEGWGVESIKHSLVYGGGQGRGCTRTFAPAVRWGFDAFSPFALPNVIEVAEGIPFIALTDWRHDRLYSLKGDVVSRGVEAVTGVTMPVFDKRRFQNGAMQDHRFAERFPESPQTYRRTFQAQFDA